MPNTDIYIYIYFEINSNLNFGIFFFTIKEQLITGNRNKEISMCSYLYNSYLVFSGKKFEIFEKLPKEISFS